MKLSNRKLKAFDRRGGAYMVLPWPADLPMAVASLALDEERAATRAEHIAALRIAAPIAAPNGLIHIATQVAHLRPPHDSADQRTRLRLLAHLVTPRWQRATTSGGRAPVQWSADQ